MIIENYNDTVADNYRTITTAMIRTLEHETKARFVDVVERRQYTADVLCNLAKERGLTEKDSITGKWLSMRVYDSQKYKNVPLWIAKAAYYYLIDQTQWLPENKKEWLITIALFIRENADHAFDFETLADLLPGRLNNDIGRQWLRNCIQSIKQLQIYKHNMNIDINVLDAINRLHELHSKLLHQASHALNNHHPEEHQRLCYEGAGVNKSIELLADLAAKIEKK